MAYEKKDNSGVLFKNDRKESDKQPDYTGNAMIEGREFWISAWVKEGKSGKFFSFAFKPKDFAQKKGETISERAVAAMKRGRGDSNDEMSDDIPF